MKRIFALLFTLGFALVARAQDAVFIVNPDVAETSITADEAKGVLLGTTTKWASGPVIKLAVLTEGPAHEYVIRTYTQRTTAQFDKYWKKQVFSGKGILPEQSKDEAALVAYVASTPGACGYASSSSVTDKVKVLEVK